MIRYAKTNKVICGLLLSFLLGLVGCNKKLLNGGASTVAPSVTDAVTNGSGATMSPKATLYGMMTGPDLYRSFAAVTGVNSLTPGGAGTDQAVFTRYSTDYNGLSATGGANNSGQGNKVMTDLAGQFAISAVTNDLAKPLSDPTRLTPIPLNGFTSNGVCVFTATVQTALIIALVQKLTGVSVAPNDPEVTSLLSFLNTLTPPVCTSSSVPKVSAAAPLANDAVGEQQAVTMLITAILVGSNTWH